MNTFFRCLESRIDKNNTLYGKFSLNSILSGQGNTFANSLRRSLFSDLSGLAITHFCITSKPGLSYEFTTLPGLAESVLDFSLNLKKVVLTGRVIDYKMRKKKVLPLLSATTNSFSSCIPAYRTTSEARFSNQEALRYAQTNQRFVDYYEQSSSWEPKSSSKRSIARSEVRRRNVAERPWVPSASQDLRLLPSVVPHNDITFRAKLGACSTNLWSSFARNRTQRSSLISLLVRSRAKMGFTHNSSSLKAEQRLAKLNVPSSFFNSDQIKTNFARSCFATFRPKNQGDRPYERGLSNKHDKSNFNNYYDDNEPLTRSKARPRTAEKLSNALRPEVAVPVGFLKAKGPAILRAKDLILPPGIRCVHPNQYLGTLAADGALSIKFLVAAGKGFIVQDEILYNSLSRARLLLSLNDTEAYNSGSSYPGSQNEVLSGFYASSTSEARRAVRTAPKISTAAPFSATIMSEAGLGMRSAPRNQEARRSVEPRPKVKLDVPFTFFTSGQTKTNFLDAKQQRASLVKTSFARSAVRGTKKHQASVTSTFSNKLKNLPSAVRPKVAASQNRSYIDRSDRVNKISYTRFKNSKKLIQVALSNSYETTLGQAELPLVLRSMQSTSFTFSDYFRCGTPQRRIKRLGGTMSFATEGSSSSSKPSLTLFNGKDQFAERTVVYEVIFEFKKIQKFLLYSNFAYRITDYQSSILKKLPFVNPCISFATFGQHILANAVPCTAVRTTSEALTNQRFVRSVIPSDGTCTSSLLGRNVAKQRRASLVSYTSPKVVLRKTSFSPNSSLTKYFTLRFASGASLVNQVASTSEARSKVSTAQKSYPIHLDLPTVRTANLQTMESTSGKNGKTFGLLHIQEATRFTFESTSDQIQSSKVSSENHGGAYRTHSINKTLFLPTIKNQKSRKIYYQAKEKQSSGSKENFLPYRGFTTATFGSTFRQTSFLVPESKLPVDSASSIARKGTRRTAPKISTAPQVALRRSVPQVASHSEVKIVAENKGKLRFSEKKEADLTSLSKKYGQNSSKKLAKKQLTWSAEENSYPVLPLDVTFTPVSKVNFQINVNRNSEKNEETIIFEIWTNGSITPKRAIQESCLALAQDFYNLFCNVNELSSLQLWWKRESTESKTTRAVLPPRTHHMVVNPLTCYSLRTALPFNISSEATTISQARFSSRLFESSILIAESEGKEARKFKDQSVLLSNKKLHSQVKKCTKVHFPESKNLRLKQKVHYLHAFWRLNISDLNLSLETQLLFKKLNINSVYDLHFFILKKSWSLFLSLHQQKEIVKIYLNFGLNSPF